MFGLKRFRVCTDFNEVIRPLLVDIFEDIERITIRQQFMTSLRDFLVLCEVRWRKRMDDPGQALSGLVKRLDGFEEVIMISSDRDRTLCFIKGRYMEMFTELFMHTTREYLCFIDYPVTVTKEQGVTDLVGPPKEVKRLIEFMKEWGTNLEIEAITEYHTRDRGLLSVLTDKQLSVLKQAHKRGFFDHPRKADARRISERMGMRHTTFLTHIRKGQKRMLDELFAE
jgi:hypothetical protein